MHKLEKFSTLHKLGMAVAGLSLLHLPIAQVIQHS